MVDFNSLYVSLAVIFLSTTFSIKIFIKPFVFQKDLPVGPGIAFEKDGKRFKMKSMHSSGKKTSLGMVHFSFSFYLYKKQASN